MFVLLLLTYLLTPWPWPWPWIGSYGIPSYIHQRNRGFFNETRYINLRFTYLLTHQISLKSEKLCGWTDAGGRGFISSTNFTPRMSRAKNSQQISITKEQKLARYEDGQNTSSLRAKSHCELNCWVSGRRVNWAGIVNTTVFITIKNEWKTRLTRR